MKALVRGMPLFARKKGLLGRAIAGEVSGDGRRADILATSRPERIAFELQWSAQSPEETRARSLRCARAGLRVVWRLRQRMPPELECVSVVLCVGVANPKPGEYIVSAGAKTVSVPELVEYRLDPRRRARLVPYGHDGRRQLSGRVNDAATTPRSSSHPCCRLLWA